MVDGRNYTEKIVEKFKLNLIKTKIKKKPGQPKKNTENKDNQ